MDAGSVLHVDRECQAICKFETYATPISRYPTNKVTRGLWEHICSKCVSDASFSEIERQISENIVADEKAKVSAEKLYNILCDLGECEYSTFDSFYQYVIKEKDNWTRFRARLEAKGYDVDSLIEEVYRVKDIERLDTLSINTPLNE